MREIHDEANKFPLLRNAVLSPCFHVARVESRHAKFRATDPSSKSHLDLQPRIDWVGGKGFLRMPAKSMIRKICVLRAHTSSQPHKRCPGMSVLCLLFPMCRHDKLKKRVKIRTTLTYHTFPELFCTVQELNSAPSLDSITRTKRRGGSNI